LFDDSETESEEEPFTIRKEVTKPAKTIQTSEMLSEEEESEKEKILEVTKPSNPVDPEPYKPPAPLDFAAELSRKLASKNKLPQQQPEKIPEPKDEQVFSQPAMMISKKQVSNIFDDESDEENKLFAAPTGKPVPVDNKFGIKDKPRKSLFYDSGDEEVTSSKEVVSRTKAQLAASKDPVPTQTNQPKKFSLFDNNSEEDDSGDLFAAAQATKFPPNVLAQTNRKNVSLFSDSSDTDKDDMFSSKSKKPEIINSTLVEEKKLVPKTETVKSVLGNSIDDIDDLFAVAKKTEQQKTTASKSLFDEDEIKPRE